MTTLVDPAFLAAFGATPKAAATRLRGEIERFEAAALARGADWLSPPAPGRWNPAQLTEHLLLANASFGKVIHLLASGRPLPETPRTPGRLVDGRAVAPDFLEPGPGSAWAELAPRWQEAHARLLEVAAGGSDPARTFWHPYFGDLDALGWTRAAAWHTRHHRGQLA